MESTVSSVHLCSLRILIKQGTSLINPIAVILHCVSKNWTPTLL